MGTADNFEIITEIDPLNPFDVDSMYPCVLVPGYTCPTCLVTSKTPIFVKSGSTTKFYCRNCHSEIKKIH